MRDRLKSKECSRYLKALSDPERLRIVQQLQVGPSNVTELARALRIELANASHHLGVLRQAGLVCDRKQGKYVIYSLDPAVFRGDPSDTALGVLDFGCCRLELGDAS